MWKGFSIINQKTIASANTGTASFRNTYCSVKNLFYKKLFSFLRCKGKDRKPYETREIFYIILF